MAELTKNEQSEFNDLCFHWDSAYVIAYNGVFSATRMDGSGRELWAATPTGLRDKIRQDYVRWGLALVRDRATL